MQHLYGQMTHFFATLSSGRSQLGYFPFTIGDFLALLLMLSKAVGGTEYIYTQPTKLSQINHDASAITFTNFSMSTIATAAFWHLLQCKTLVFMSTRTIRIDPDAWRGLSKLESLSIEKSFMTTLDKDVFAHLKSLTRLKITTIRNAEQSRDSGPLNPAAFRGLFSLNSLWLSLPKLNERTFRHLDNDVWGGISSTLTELMLPENDFTELYDHMFMQFPNLVKLSFRNNKILTISSEAFSGLGVLGGIDLSQNKIQDIPNGAFGTLASLNEIDLSGNEIEHLADYLFKGLKQLRVLKLNNNRLQTIECSVFDPMDFSSTGGHPGMVTIHLPTL